MFNKIFCPIDGSETSSHCLTEAIKIAKAHRSRLMILHIVDDFYPFLDGLEIANLAEIEKELRKNGEKLLKKAAERASSEGIKTESKLVEVLSKKIPTVLLEEADKWGADLIIIGTHGRRGINHLMLGSNTENLIRISSIPVLTIRHKQ